MAKQVAQMIRMLVSVPMAELQAALAAFTAIGVTATLLASADDVSALAATGVDTDNTDEETPVDRAMRRANTRSRARATVAQVRTQVRTHRTGNGGGRRKLYATAATRAQINRALETAAKGSLQAFVLRYVVAHPNTTKRAIVDAASKAGHNGESVDNVVWKFQTAKPALLKSIDAA